MEQLLSVLRQDLTEYACFLVALYFDPYVLFYFFCLDELLLSNPWFLLDHKPTEAVQNQDLMPPLYIKRENLEWIYNSFEEGKKISSIDSLVFTAIP